MSQSLKHQVKQKCMKELPGQVSSKYVFLNRKGYALHPGEADLQVREDRARSLPWIMAKSGHL